MGTNTEIEDYQDENPEVAGRTHRLEVIIGLFLVLVVAGFVIYNYVNRSALSNHYRTGVDALNNHDLDLAVTELTASGDYLNSASLLRNANTLVGERDSLYAQIESATAQGKWWDASKLLDQMQAIQKGYKDTDALLAKANQTIGSIYYGFEPNISDKGIFTAEANGDNQKHIDGSLFYVGTSPDSKWLVYFGTTGMWLYNSETASSRELNLITTGTAARKLANYSVRFAPDSSNLVITTPDSALTFNLDAAQTATNTTTALMPTRHEEKATYNTAHETTLLLLTDTQKITTVAINSNTATQPITTETGTVDGALFTKDGRYLLYRVCHATPNFTSECSLKLTDSTKPSQVTTIVTLSALTATDAYYAPLGEFTQDGTHILLTEGRSGVRNYSIYDIASGRSSKISINFIRDMPDRMSDDYVLAINDYVPGLQAWKGHNSLTHTDNEEYQFFYDATLIRTHWVTISPNNRFAIVLGARPTDKGVDYWLESVPLDWDNPDTVSSGNTILDTMQQPDEWLPTLRFLGDGYTLLTSADLAGAKTPGIYSYDLAQNRDPELLIPNARLIAITSASFSLNQ